MQVLLALSVVGWLFYVPWAEQQDLTHLQPLVLKSLRKDDKP